MAGGAMADEEKLAVFEAVALRAQALVVEMVAEKREGGWTLRLAEELLMWFNAGVKGGREIERAHLQPLLERCYSAVDDRILFVELERELGLED